MFLAAWSGGEPKGSTAEQQIVPVLLSDEPSPGCGKKRGGNGTRHPA
jgi:hypothetical protein